MLADRQPLGLFELDTTGRVLYFRLEPREQSPGALPDFTGRNLYEEVLPFENVEEFRNLVTEFARGKSPADSFRFDCRYQDDTLAIKVLLARISARTDTQRMKSVLVYIRKVV